jgi:tetratricopeptide (TPR) repeat protein
MRTPVVFTALLVFAFGTAHAQEKRVVTTATAMKPSELALGAEHRGDYNDAMRTLSAGDPDKAVAMLGRIAAACEAYARPGLRLVAAFDAAEYDRYVAQLGDGTPIEWLDMVCPSTFKTVAFLAWERKESPDVALQRLQQATALAPFWPDPHVERGFVLTQIGRAEEGLAAYREAIRLSELPGADTSSLAIAWRGVGYSNIELKRWNDARAAYAKALEIEPDNHIALNELAYIDQQDPQPAAAKAPAEH